MTNNKIEIEDRTKPMTNEQLTDSFGLLNQECAKAFKALSDNDQIIMAQTKSALEEITEKVLYLSNRVNLFADLIEELIIKKIETDEVSFVVKLSKDEYKELVYSLKG